MTVTQAIEVLAAVALIGLGVWRYRQRSPDGEADGTQGAVILFVVAALLLIHGLGWLEYHPSQAELER